MLGFNVNTAYGVAPTAVCCVLVPKEGPPTTPILIIARRPFASMCIHLHASNASSACFFVAAAAARYISDEKGHEFTMAAMASRVDPSRSHDQR